MALEEIAEPEKKHLFKATNIKRRIVAEAAAEEEAEQVWDEL